MINGKNITLREIRLTDKSFFLKWFNDLEVIKYLSMYRPISEPEENNWLEKIGNNTDIIFVIETKEKRPIGTCGIHKIDHKNRNAKTTIIIGEKKLWGKGLGTEASGLLQDYCFLKLNLHRIYTGVYNFNKRSIKSLKKLGYKKEGIQKEAIYKNGKYHDIILFALIKSEWKKIKSHP